MDKAHDSEAIIDIRDESIDTEAIMRLIRENIRRRRSEAEAQGLDYEAFVEGLYASKVSARFDNSLYYDLRRMSVSYDKIGVGLSLTSVRLPLLGPLIQRVRTALHHLVIYYVNMLAGQQTRFNEYVMRAVTTLVKDLEETPDPRQWQQLKEEVVQLRQRLDRLEASSRSEEA
ncbi:MAG: hypothetical protein GX620_02805 [Chloroflexi bacterium]|nr:hypothetical protein [Chloroflexota bacterium]